MSMSSAAAAAASLPDPFESLESGRSPHALGPPEPLPPEPSFVQERLVPAAASVFESVFADEFDDGSGGDGMRQRHTAPATENIELPPLVESSVRRAAANATVLSTNITRTRSSVFKRCRPQLERCYQARIRVRNTLCGCLIVGTLLAIVVGLLSDQSAYVVDAARPVYARSGVDGVRFDQPAQQLTCGEIEAGSIRRPSRRGEPTSLARVRERMQYLMDIDQLECICAPMVGSARQYALVRSSATAVLDMFNAYVDGDWDGRVDDETRLDVDARSFSLEQQEHLFPGRSDVVEKVRLDNVRLVYLDAQCTTQSVVVRNKRARCMQSCIDLMNGRSIYDDNT